MLRAGDTAEARYYRADRFFAVNFDWYFSTRDDGDQGPHPSKRAAEKALAYYIRASQPLGQDLAETLNPLVRELERGYAELIRFNVSDAWKMLSGAAQQLDLAIPAEDINTFERCNTVLCAVEQCYAQGEPRLNGLPRSLKDYSRNAAIMPFPFSGMLMPERLYLKQPSKSEVFCCKVTESGSIVVADAHGQRVEEERTGMQLDARMTITMLIGKMRGTIAG